ncbi:hypothetical protein B0H63DRAFT_51104 [Podospora didyma]|uniref:Uncharacterized protein n=1 Tax=Podospora didyma TaxID=330526 RepID=A0AAE0U8E0_9PEZI|nr:hypothetical protein B0H63DRAFT_51104 [Podospora didyma]
MALTVKHLNGDASFLLTFEPLILHSSHASKPFHILLDPWITGPSKIFHSKISMTTHEEPACISSLLELPEPDLVIVSQNKSDHCNRATLQQLPPIGTKTIILAEPRAARTIQGWNHFERGKVRTIPKWEDHRVTSRQTIVRISVPSTLPGDPGEVTVAFIPQRRDVHGLHSAIGITYRPPLVASPYKHQPRRPGSSLFTPPPTPKSLRSQRSHGHLPSSDFGGGGGGGQNNLPPTPTSPSHESLRSVRSASSLFTLRNSCYYSTTSQAALDRPLSVIFSPHGINYSSLHSYVTSHLISEAALPLTALLHCFDSVCNPWWLGGNILLGAPAGTETASRLGARAWISAHDGKKVVKGLATGFLRTRKWAQRAVVDQLNSRQALEQRSRGGGGGGGKKESRRKRRGCNGDGDDDDGDGRALKMLGSPTTQSIASREGTDNTSSQRANTTKVLALTTGDEVVLTNEAIRGQNLGQDYYHHFALFDNNNKDVSNKWCSSQTCFQTSSVNYHQSNPISGRKPCRLYRRS